MTPRVVLGLSFGLSLARSVTAFAQEPGLPPLEGGPGAGAPSPAPPPTTPPTTTQPPAPPAAPPPGAPPPAAQPPASAPPSAPPPAATAPAQGTETPAATAPTEPPPPVYEAESDFPELDAPGESTSSRDELSTAPPATRKTPAEERGRRRWEIHLGLGGGDAAGRHDWPTHGAVAFSLVGGYRFTPHFSVGLEAAGWSYTPDDDDTDDVDVSSNYFAPYVRYYFLDQGKLDPYVMTGFGFGSFAVDAKSDDVFPERVESRGWALPVGVGIDWQLGKVFRLGPQALVYWYHSTEVCTTLTDDDDQVCQDRGDSGNDRDADALPWRITINGTFTFGAR